MLRELTVLNNDSSSLRRGDVRSRSLSSFCMAQYFQVLLLPDTLRTAPAQRSGIPGVGRHFSRRPALRGKPSVTNDFLSMLNTQ